jgi:DNA repair protein RadC
LPRAKGADGAAGKDDRPHYLGHRQRLRERFLAQPEAFPDYELMELLLTLAHTRADVKPLAKTLVDQFGSYAGAIAASPQQLQGVEGVGPSTVAVLKLAQESAARLIKGQVMGREIVSSWSALIDYVRARQGFEDTEQFRILFLDRKNAVIADEKQQKGTVDHTPLYPREVVKRALELGASAMILVHNHPSGDTTPSRSDIEMTREVVRAAAALGLTVHDHVIIGRSGHTSMKAKGLF